MKTYLCDCIYEDGQYTLGVLAQTDDQAMNIVGNIDEPGCVDSVQLHLIGGDLNA
jgi:hypothetical protein